MISASLSNSLAIFIHTDPHPSAVCLLRESRYVRLANTTLRVLRCARIAAEVLQQIICTIKIGCTPTRHDNNGYSRIISVPTILSTVEKYLSKSLICEL